MTKNLIYGKKHSTNFYFQKGLTKNLYTSGAFSLAEMMVVMLIMSIVLAAMAPMITTRIKADQALKAGEAAAPQEDNNPWKWVEGSDTDAYSQASRNMIGQTAAEEDDGDAMLIINKGKDDKADILFKNSNGSTRLDMMDFGGNSQFGLSYKGIILGDTPADSVGRTSGGISIGFENTGMGYRSAVVGYENTLDGGGRVFGNQNTVKDAYVVGQHNKVIGNSMSVLGSGTTSQKQAYGAIIGINNTINTGNESYLLGRQNTVGNGGSHVLGSYNELNGYRSIVVGNENTTALSSQYDTGTCYAFGQENSVSGRTFSMAIGMENEVTGENSIAIGNYSKATAYNSLAIGIDSYYKSVQTTASGQYSLALGGAKATGDYSVAIGRYAQATGKYAIVICTNDSFVYMPDGNTRLPYSAVASGKYSVAIGYHAEAKSDYEFVLGYKDHNVKIPGTLEVSKTLKANGTNVTSDKRLKYIKGENKSGLDKIRQIKVYDFTFKKDENKEPRVGIIAQELQKILPDAVKKGTDGFLTIRIDDIIYTLVNAVKELDRKVSELTETLKQVQTEQKRINQRLDALEHKSVH